jgi:FKBP-type peptidyl-prolyl cis-trans isomerase SlyD
MPFQMMTPSGLSIVHVTKVEGNKITIDGNHELAGQTLNFDIEVVGVRDATAEELAPTSGCGGGCGGCGGCGGGDCGSGGCGNGCGGCN